jgi:zinc transport system substrate-binding protein
MTHAPKTALAAITVLAVWLSFTVAASARKPLRVVATIEPVHALVAGVMAGVGEPMLLVKGGGSPHTYALRPSEARALERADVVFWIGEALETFLRRPLQALPRDARIVALSEAKGVVLLASGESGGEEGRSDTHMHTWNMHIWLDPVNAKAMVAAIAAALADADPERASVYAANAERLRTRLDRLDATLRVKLAAVVGRGFVVFHDAYRYFDRRYRLGPAIAIAVNPARQPGAGTIRAVREKIIALGPTCVFIEPQFVPALIHSIVAGTRARTAVLDPLGSDLGPDADAYFTLMHNLAKSLVDCLTRTERRSLDPVPSPGTPGQKKSPR